MPLVTHAQVPKLDADPRDHYPSNKE
jgi:hypothetical protein